VIIGIEIGTRGDEKMDKEPKDSKEIVENGAMGDVWMWTTGVDLWMGA